MSSYAIESKAVVLSKKTALTRAFVIVCLAICLVMFFYSTLPAIAKLTSLMASSSSGLAPRFSEVIVSVMQLVWPLCLLGYLIYQYIGRHRCSRYVLAQGALVGERTCCGVTWGRVVYDIVEGDQLEVAEEVYYNASRRCWIYPIILRRAQGSALVLQYALGKRAAASTVAQLRAHYPSLSEASSYTKPALSPQQLRMRNLCLLAFAMVNCLLAMSSYYYSHSESTQHWEAISARREAHEPINAARLRYDYEGVSYTSPAINLLPLLSRADDSWLQFSLFVNKSNPHLLAPRPYGSRLWLYLGIACVLYYLLSALLYVRSFLRIKSLSC